MVVVYIRQVSDEFSIFITYVDDCLYATKSLTLTKNVMRSARVPHAQNADLKSAAGTHFAYQLLHHYRFVFCLTAAS